MKAFKKLYQTFSFMKAFKKLYETFREKLLDKNFKRKAL